MEEIQNSIFADTVEHLKRKVENSRIFFVLKIEEKTRIQIEGYLNLWENKQVTGAIFNLVNKFFIFFLEGSNENLFGALDNLAKECGYTTDLKVLHFSDLNSTKLSSYLIYNSCLNSLGHVIEEDNCIFSKIWNFYESILDMHYKIANKKSKEESMTFVQMITDQLLKPRYDLLENIYKEEYNYCIWTFQEFNDFFLSPYKLNVRSKWMFPDPFTTF